MMKKLMKEKIMGYVAHDELGLISIQDYFVILASSKRSMQDYLITAGIDKMHFAISPIDFETLLKTLDQGNDYAYEATAYRRFRTCLKKTMPYTFFPTWETLYTGISPTQFIPIRLGLPDSKSWFSAIGE